MVLSGQKAKSYLDLNPPPHTHTHTHTPLRHGRILVTLTLLQGLPGTMIP